MPCHTPIVWMTKKIRSEEGGPAVQGSQAANHKNGDHSTSSQRPVSIRWRSHCRKPRQTNRTFFAKIRKAFGRSFVIWEGFDWLPLANCQVNSSWSCMGSEIRLCWSWCGLIKFLSHKCHLAVRWITIWVRGANVIMKQGQVSTSFTHQKIGILFQNAAIIMLAGCQNWILGTFSGSCHQPMLQRFASNTFVATTVDVEGMWPSKQALEPIQNLLELISSEESSLLGFGDSSIGWHRIDCCSLCSEWVLTMKGELKLSDEKSCVRRWCVCRCELDSLAQDKKDINWLIWAMKSRD